jgi:hypothetical protein
MPVKLWICADYNDGGCTPEEPCQEGECGWRHYASVAEALDSCILTCPECDRSMGPDDPMGTRKPAYIDGAIYCSQGCYRRARKSHRRNSMARRDVQRCCELAGLLPGAAEYLWLTGKVSGGPYLPTVRATYPWGRATLYLGTEAHTVTTSLRAWSACTGLPIPPPKRYNAEDQLEGPHNPPDARTHEEALDVAVAWLTPAVYGADLERWDAAARKLGLHSKWAHLGGQNA